MPALQIKADVEASLSPVHRVPRPVLAGSAAVAVPSPVQDLQRLVELAYMPEPQVEKWSPTRRLLFLGGAVFSSWGVVLVGLRVFLG